MLFVMASVAELAISQRGEPLNPPTGSKLELVVNTLRERASRGEIFVTGPAVKRESMPGFSEWINFFVAPPKGIFDAGKLERFRAGLFPNVQSSNHSEVREETDGMEFGFVAFDDKLVDIERTTTSIVRQYEPGALARLKLEKEHENTKTTSKHFERRTFVNVVPHPIIANVILQIKDDTVQFDYLTRLEHRASSKVLKKVQELARREDRGRGSSYEDYAVIKEALIEEEIALLIGSLRRLSPMKRELLEKLLS